jgi:CheY-like chemotaxis protein
VSEAIALAREVALEGLLGCMDAEDLMFLVAGVAGLPGEADGLQTGLSPDEVRMARLRRADAWHVIEEVIPSLDVVLIRAAEAARQTARLCLNPVEESLLALVDGVRPVRDVVTESSGTTFDVCRVLYRLVEGGVVRIKHKRGEGSPARIRRVFVVDSDVERVYPGVVEALSELEQGIEVRCHRESLNRIPWAIRVYQPDALLLDVRLDGFDGVKLVKLLRHSAEFHSMQIVATGEGLSDEEDRHLRRVGFSRVLPKPFLADQLCAAILGDAGETSPADLGPGL